MNRRFSKGDTQIQLACEKILNIISHRENANQNQDWIHFPPPTPEDGYNKKGRSYRCQGGCGGDRTLIHSGRNIERYNHFIK